MKIAIDLLWVRVGIVGGTESYIRSILDGFQKYDSKNEYILLVAEDNHESFQKYTVNSNIKIVICEVNCSRPWKRIIWENLHFHQTVLREKADLVFVPVYSMPFHIGHKLPYLCTIHDLQALHYPTYFSMLKRIFLSLSWKYTCRSADMIITDSDFCKNDIITRFPEASHKTETIYPAVNPSGKTDVFHNLQDRYGISENDYFYCVSSLLPHKNLSTILKVMAEYNKNHNPKKLLISGVGGNDITIKDMIQNLQIEEYIVLTGYISNEERDSLYGNCYMFLFPSVFEGFGIPPIEAMQMGKKTIMTKMSCLYETSKGFAYYVEKPLEKEAWLKKIDEAADQDEKEYFFKEYQQDYVVNRFLNIFQEIYTKKQSED